MDQKSQQDALFFSHFSRKSHLSHAHILSRKRPFSKKPTALKSIFDQKTSVLSETLCSNVSFSKFLRKTPCGQANMWSKKRQFCQNYTILWAQQVKNNVFSDFLQNIIASTLIFCQKNVHSLKNTLLSCPYVVKKSQFSKKLYSHIIFFLILNEKPLAAIPIFGQKTSILSNYNILWGKTVNKLPFFLIFVKKYCSNGHIL